MVFEIISGIAILVITISGLIFNIKFFKIFTTPLVWTAYLLILDYFNFKLTKKSKIFHKTKEFLIMVILSIILWWLFEWFNIFISNWYYINLVKPLIIRYLGYFWSFATILPGIMFTFELLINLKLFNKVKTPKINISKNTLIILLIIGFIFLLLPVISFSSKFTFYAADSNLFFWLKYILPFSIRKYLAAFVWLSFIFLIDPIIFLINRKVSILNELINGKPVKLLCLIVAGLICGFYWESWNYFALSKWKYDVPILRNLKIFEMPVLGYFGFSAFAIELYLFYNFLTIPLNKFIDKKLNN